jgi:hypothetical protein
VAQLYNVLPATIFAAVYRVQDRPVWFVAVCVRQQCLLLQLVSADVSCGFTGIYPLKKGVCTVQSQPVAQLGQRKPSGPPEQAVGPDATASHQHQYHNFNERISTQRGRELMAPAAPSHQNECSTAAHKCHELGTAGPATSNSVNHGSKVVHPSSTADGLQHLSVH